MPELILLLLVAGMIVIVGLAVTFAYEAMHPRRRTTAYAIARGIAADPEERGWSHESWVLDRPDGAHLPVWEITGAGGPAAPVVIFLHGWGESKVDSLARAELWHPLASRLVMYDLRGHGEATGSRCRLGDGEENDLLALIERLRAKRIILIGHSLGATIALFAAAKPREREGAPEVVSLIAVAPYRIVHTPIRLRLRMLHLPSRPVTDVAMALLRCVGIRQRDTAMAAREISAPVFVIHGNHDQIAPIEDGRAIADAAPNGELITVEGADHFSIFHDEYANARMIERVDETLSAQ